MTKLRDFPGILRGRVGFQTCVAATAQVDSRTGRAICFHDIVGTPRNMPRNLSGPYRSLLVTAPPAMHHASKLWSHFRAPYLIRRGVRSRHYEAKWSDIGDLTEKFTDSSSRNVAGAALPVPGLLLLLALSPASISPSSARFFVAVHHTAAAPHHCAVGGGSGCVHHKRQKGGGTELSPGFDPEMQLISSVGSGHA